ncbi:hypothetical protein CVU37_05640 [candidate division BRC1 bacterium HGW-BRC1-1]|jgi:hypothetical protein|nr:MAG: hypothetical protein CVU37_05640 [candidate division BRC1 bacterium HGW-BRC1-1]
MAHAYTPGLVVSERTLVVKRRLLPIRGEVKVALGDKVDAKQVVARTELPGNVQLVNVAHHLGIEPADVADRMKVQVGHKVSRGDTIAENVGLFGLFRSHVSAPCDCMLETISKVTGQVLLREPPQPLEVFAYISGEVTEVIEAEGVDISTVGTFIQGIIGVGGEKQGIIRVIARDPDHKLRAEEIDESCAGMVVVGGRCADLAAYRRCEEVGAVGLVVGSFDDSDLGAILGYDLGIAITGGENIGTSLIMTEGFGDLTMAARTFELLGKLDGRTASINGATQIRAGVIRPEIIVSSDVPASSAQPVQGTATAIGARVRIIRQPHFGQIARITDLPSDPVTIESGAVVRVMTVELPGGTQHTLPRANVELIEE